MPDAVLDAVRELVPGGGRGGAWLGGRCDMDEQSSLGIELMIRGLDCGNDDPGC